MAEKENLELALKSQKNVTSIFEKKLQTAMLEKEEIEENMRIKLQNEAKAMSNSSSKFRLTPQMDFSPSH